MKIAFLSFYSGMVNRGVETYTHELANHLTDSDFPVTVYQNGSKLPGSKYSTVSLGLKVNLDRSSTQIPFVNYLSKRIKDFTSQVLSQIDPGTGVIIPTNGQWQSFMSRKWAAGRGSQVIISGQSGIGLDDRINLYSFPHVFVALTQTQRSWAKSVNPFVRVEKIPNGVDLEKFNPKIPPLHINLPRPVILCVSALTRWKRLDLVIKAVSRTKEASLLLVGQGHLQEDLQSLGNKLLPGRFQILSFPHHKMPGVYRSADLFTYATVPWESFGIALLEAMACNLPIVATDDLIRREIVGNAGLFTNPSDTNHYTEKISQALNTNWHQKPRLQSEKFSWGIIAAQYKQLLVSLV